MVTGEQRRDGIPPLLSGMIDAAQLNGALTHANGERWLGIDCGAIDCLRSTTSIRHVQADRVQ